MQRVVLISGHYFESRRKAGFHWLAEAFWKAGWDVTFMTTAISRLSRLKGDYRFEYPILQEANRLKPVRERLKSFVWYTPWHPANLRVEVLNWLATPLFSRYGQLDLGEVERALGAADLVIFESNPALILFERMKALNPNARLVYRVSDDIRMLRNHRSVIAAEDRFAPFFDLVSVPSEFLHRHFAHLPNAHIHLHGIDKKLFEGEWADPFAAWRTGNARQALFVGNSYFDYDFIDRASRLLGDWHFHVVGPIRGLPLRSNVHAYGEVSFQQTLPFLRHADVALLNRSYASGAESLTDSLKVIQYTWCRLPIVAPEFLRTAKPHVFYYQPGRDESIERALREAAAFDRSRVAREHVRSWEELRAVLEGVAEA